MHGIDLGPSPADPTAPWCEIANQNIVSVEHPGVIKKIDYAISSLGGDSKIGYFFESDSPIRCLGLLLRPEDAFRRSINSRTSKTANLVLQFSVPKRTGRKRKRGSSEPFTYCEKTGQSSAQHDTSHMLQSLRDNSSITCIKAVGSIQETHRFRAAPDFQYSVVGSPLARTLRKSVLTFEYNNSHFFKIDTRTQGFHEDIDLIPPPTLSQRRVPFNYSYRQNPSVKLVHDESGKAVMINTATTVKTANQLVAFDVEAIPFAAPAHLASEDTLHPKMQALIKQVREVFEQRPIITRRALCNKLPRNRLATSRRNDSSQDLTTLENAYELKWALRYVCYMFRSGPWKDTLIKLGIDPRTDVKFRVYQTVAFQIEGKVKMRAWEDSRLRWQRSNKGSQPDTESHLFDGKKIVLDGKIWQACDITDSLLRKILDTDTLRSTCHIQQDGWYNNGVWAKLRAIMRDKIAIIMSGEEPLDLDYIRISQMPNVLDKSNLHLAQITNPTSKESSLAASVRVLATNIETQNRKLGLLGLESQRLNADALDDDDGDNDEVAGQVTLEDATVLTDDDDGEGEEEDRESEKSGDIGEDRRDDEDDGDIPDAGDDRDGSDNSDSDA